VFVQIGDKAFNPNHVTSVEFGSGYASVWLRDSEEPLEFIYGPELDAFRCWWQSCANVVDAMDMLERGRAREARLARGAGETDEIVSVVRALPR